MFPKCVSRSSQDIVNLASRCWDECLDRLTRCRVNSRDGHPRGFLLILYIEGRWGQPEHFAWSEERRAFFVSLW